MATDAERWLWCEQLESLGFTIQQRVHEMLVSSVEDLAAVVAHQGGDTVFAIDRHVESLILSAVEAWPSRCKPLVLVCEGLGEDGVRQIGSGTPRFRLLVDPIDGTRGLMYDKRSAWFIAAVAPDRGPDTTLDRSITRMPDSGPVISGPSLHWI